MRNPAMQRPCAFGKPVLPRNCRIVPPQHPLSLPNAPARADRYPHKTCLDNLTTGRNVASVKALQTKGHDDGSFRDSAA